MQTYRVRQLFDDGSQSHMEGLGHEDLLALVETFPNLPSMLVCMIAVEDDFHPVATINDMARLENESGFSNEEQERETREAAEGR